jgi:chemotaxis receptor (MCP) glutamine deamidase CheD/CheY-like chemotaxis protein
MVTLFNKKLKMGGMNHFVLPKAPANSPPNFRYGDHSIEAMLKAMQRYDKNLSNISAMLFGGGNVVGHLSSGAGIGYNNVALAREMLASYGIPVTKEDTGGKNGRKLRYCNWNNEVEVRKIEKSEYTQDMEKREGRFAKNGVKVLVVDDSPIVCKLLTQALNEDPEIEVVGEAHDAYEARSMILEHNPDCITLDIIMPKLDGVTFLKKLMIHYPKPVIIVSTIAKEGSTIRERAEKVGAVSVIDKEKLNLYREKKTVRDWLTREVKEAARQRVGKKSVAELANL